MQYRKDKQGNELSILGYGCMRFTNKNGKIDLEKAEREILTAYQNGVNYYDTAYIYPGSEEALGIILEKNNIRDKVNIATKLPQYMINSANALDKYFNEELKRLRTDHIDYYLMHHLTDYVQWDRLKKLGIESWIKDKKEKGLIKNIGFSYHGNSELFIKILNDYKWDFAQIQYNYLDENSQAGKLGVKEAEKLNIPIIIMEPLRGGKLVNMLPEKAKTLIKNNKRHYSAAEWSFRWLYNQKAVTVVLSGMNSIQMVNENCEIASSAKEDSFTNEDYELINQIIEEIRKTEKIACTGCRYCMPCVKGIDIPGLFAAYNRMYSESKTSGRAQYAQAVALRKDVNYASACIKCGKCEAHCPQSIPIREKIIEADKALRPLPIKIAINILKTFMLREAK
ncbi:MAG: aldo/keto reductase [Erysipelotrichaceae bacterium]|nr:aldo/keto reductase [Erysipelotrichaceae bacterium]